MKYANFALLSLLFPLFALAASPNNVVAEASHLLAQELVTRKEELTNDKSALYAAVDGILQPRLDRKLAAQLVLGKHWRNASDIQKDRFVDAFYLTLLHRYADGVLEFDPERMKIFPFRGDENDERGIVKTEVRLEDGTPVPVSYSMIKRPQGWLLYDVVIEGISYVRNFRAELDREISATDLDTVISRLQSDAHSNIAPAAPR